VTDGACIVSRVVTGVVGSILHAVCTTRVVNDATRVRPRVQAGLRRGARAARGRGERDDEGSDGVAWRGVPTRSDSHRFTLSTSHHLHNEPGHVARDAHRTLENDRLRDRDT